MLVELKLKVVSVYWLIDYRYNNSVRGRLNWIMHVFVAFVHNCANVKNAHCSTKHCHVYRPRNGSGKQRCNRVKWLRDIIVPALAAALILRRLDRSIFLRENEYETSKRSFCINYCTARPGLLTHNKESRVQNAFRVIYVIALEGVLCLLTLSSYQVARLARKYLALNELRFFTVLARLCLVRYLIINLLFLHRF